ncbi:lysophospholipase [Youhaiella tibetensis]|uniref:Lysophospholipase n=1 Tax=Paradevosia tibetensis TaxID=1447062 RepID=A0A5B9DRM9_9HYPH|nr:alpha/beta fold hydrolase [Youhaiella tibetensis]QEE22081.1 lysophospholipase [Youhaiella tibetensis]
MGASALAGLVFAIAALAAANVLHFEVSWDLGNKDGLVTWATLFLGVFLTGWLLWWAIMVRPGPRSLWRGAATGIIIAVVSYPVVFTLTELLQRDAATVGTLSERVRGIILVTGLTLMITGFAMTLIMAVVGAVIAYAVNRSRPQAEAAPWMPVVGKGAQLAGVVAAIILALLVGSFVTLSVIPTNARSLVPDGKPGNPAASYEEAMAAFEAIRKDEAGLGLHERCPSQLLTHGHKVARVVIYFHGLTSCPAQGEELAQALFAQGYNVYLPRMKGHGLADPDTLALMDLTAEDLVDLANQSVDLAQGLGDEVAVVGLSAGGTIVTWIAQYRPDVANAIAVSPFLGPYVIPPWATNAANTLALMLPDIMLWWNPTETVGEDAQTYAFPTPSVHTLAQVMRLGRVVEEGARQGPPAVKQIGMLLNSADIAVSNALAQQLIASWRSHGQEVTVKTLALSRLLPHDLINPGEPQADTKLVYATILELLGSPPAGNAD